MSPPSRKQARNQKKRRDRKQRKAKSQAVTKQSLPPSPHIPLAPRLTPTPEPDSATLSPVDRWWKQYFDADGQKRLFTYGHLGKRVDEVGDGQAAALLVGGLRKWFPSGIGKPGAEAIDEGEHGVGVLVEPLDVAGQRFGGP